MMIRNNQESWPLGMIELIKPTSADWQKVDGIIRFNPQPVIVDGIVRFPRMAQSGWMIDDCYKREREE